MGRIKILTFLFFSLSILIVNAQKNPSTSKEAEQYFTIAQKSLLNLNFKKSLIYAEKTLFYALKNDDKLLAAKCYNIIGLNFEEIADLNKAISFYKKGIYLANQVSNDTVSGWLYNNLGGVYSYNKIDLQKGLYFYKQALEKSIIIKNKWEIYYTKLNIAINYFNLKAFPEGKKYLDEIKEPIDASDEVEAKLSMYSLYGSYYYEYENNFEKAEACFLKAVQWAKKNNIELVKLNMVDLYDDISKFYQKYDKPKEAYYFLKQHDSLEDIIFDEKRQDILKNEFQSIKLGEINDKILKIESENKDYIKKLKNSRLFIGGLVLVIVLTVISLFVLYKNLKKNSRINKRLKKTNLELKRAKNQSEEAARLKSQFMSTVSHELRTPLYGVIGMTEIIENEHENLKESKYFNALKYSSKYLLSLINDILDVYKIEEGKVELVKEPIQLRNELSIIIGSLQVIADQNDNKIEIEVDAQVPVWIVSDKTRLSQILINLLSNSLKFTKKGLVQIKVEKYTSQFLKFQVIDNGLGIPKDYLDKIFDKFVQVERKSDVHYQGTGLGLSIVKKTVELFGGKIQIESIENKGTDVTFTIPLELTNANENEVVITPETVSKLKLDVSILVVEDNKVNQLVTQKMLEKNKLTCTIVDSGYKAIDILKNQHFDLVLMDINMPGIDGFETTAEIRKFNPQVPIVALTASDKFEIQKLLEKSSMNDILVKPFEWLDLLHIIEKHIQS